MTGEKEKTVHNIILQNRRLLSVSGVTDVDRFDEKAVLLYTSMGELTVTGSDLHVNSVSVESGEMTVEGDISSVVYGDKDRRCSLSAIAKLFR